MFRSSFLTNLDYRYCRLLAVAWMAFIFYMSSQPSIPVPQAIWGQDKFMHFVSYGILGFLLAKSLKESVDGLTWKQIAWVAVAAALYGLSDEFHQMFVPGRDASVGDLVADALGGLAGAMLLRRREV